MITPVLQSMVYGIYLLTTSDRSNPHAMIVSWVTQLSWDPLRVGVAIRKGRAAQEIIRRGENFALHLLSRDARLDIEVIRARLKEWKQLESGTIGTGRSGAPVLPDTMGVLECRLNEVFDVGDHQFFVGDVIFGELFREGQALCTRDHGHNTYLGQS
jgi:flavin reductase (DIM6/NTAB) family NADH-FMN oxidoreductase RutF